MSRDLSDPAVAAAQRYADARTARAEQQLDRLRVDLARQAEEAAAVERERAALVVEHRRRFGL